MLVLNAQYKMNCYQGLPQLKSKRLTVVVVSLLNNYHCHWKAIYMTQAEMLMDDVL